VIPNLGYAYLQRYEPEHLGYAKKKLMAEKGTHIPILLGYLFTVTIYKFEIIATILITQILLI